MADSSFEKEFLESHNAYRQKHGTPPLKMSRDLCSSAQAWADHLLSTRALKHSNTKNGENLFYTQSSVPKKVTGKEAVDNWYSEINKYNFSRPGFISGTGHFTQVVWKDSKEVGVGLATDGKTTIVVGQYHPAGNITNEGYFEKNVLPPGGVGSRADKPQKESENKPSPTDQTTHYPDGSSGASSSFEKEFLESHNSYRQKHGAPPLKMSRDLCSSAQAWADHLLSTRALKHSDTENGENLFYTQSSIPKKVTGKEAVDNWYSEINKYNFSRPGFISGTGHFTQVVWKDSKEVGVGLATDGKTTIVVGQYHPAGNITNEGYFEKNVLPPGGVGSRADKPQKESENKPSPTDQTTHYPDGSSGASSSFEKEFLESHNSYRQKHGAPPLKMSRDLCSSAQAWADHLLSTRALKHSDTENGENLFYTQSSIPKKVTGKEAVDNWYSEINKYNFSRPGFISGTGHFTQVVWKDSKEVGVGLATDGKTTIVVGQYHPAGNITNEGYFEKNVLPPGGVGSRADKPQKESENKPSPTDQTTHYPDGSSGASSSFEKEFLESHNSYRQKHGAPPLKMSRDLCSSAQAWADHLLSTRALKHSDTENGENLFYTQSSIPKKVTGKEAVDNWYSEINKYNFSRPGFISGTGHFTQVVWKDSKEVGVGLATDGKTTIVVGQYHPAGNITNEGYFEKNVLPPGGVGSRADKPQKESENKPSPTDQTTHYPDGSSGASSSFEKEFLESHNSYRQKHGAPPLKMSRDLCSSAQAWADHLLSTRALKHSNTENGENLFYTQSSIPKKVTGKEAVDNWYSEINKYNFRRPGFISGTGHFTQVVWKDSKEVGVGLATDGKTTIVVGQYHPAGNITNEGYFEKNVLPPGSSSADSGVQSEKPPAPRKQSTPHPADPGTAPPQSNIAQQNQDTSDPDAEEFAREFLQACNKCRSTHGAPPLVPSPTINKEAQAWADKLLKESILKHSNSKHGESIWAKTGPPSTTATGQEVVDAWYKEVDNYDFSKSGVQSKTGHFTQLVWRSSKEVGVGRANSGTGKVIVVAQFEPAGNISNPGYYARNVLPKGSKVTDEPPEKETKAVPLPDKELKEFIQSLLRAQNQYRKQHGVQPLVESAALSKEAQDWAIHLVGIQILKNTNKDYGQNMWYHCGSNTATPEGLEVAESWYKESAKYSFDSPGFKSGTGNFTQMVWKSSKEVGIGLATDGNGQFICVEFFDPPGNITNPGYFRDNVLAKVSRKL